jgi:hypothetical protein
MVRFIAALSLLGLFACGNDDGGPTLDAGAPACPEDQDNFAYIHGVVSAPTCANTGCHAGGGVAGSGNLDLSGTPAEVYARLVGVATNDADGASQFPLRVEAGAPDASYFLHMLESERPVGSSLGRMPPGGALPDCDIAAIRSWIERGAPQP